VIVTTRHHGRRSWGVGVAAHRFGVPGHRRHRGRSGEPVAPRRCIGPSTCRAHRLVAGATCGAGRSSSDRFVVRRRRAAFGCRHGCAKSAPPTLTGERGDLLRPLMRCDRTPTCEVRFVALQRAGRRLQGRDEAWDFEWAPVNATKRRLKANPN
jgi:hypothetical protein